MSDGTARESLAEVGRILVARRALTEDALLRALELGPETEDRFFAQLLDAGECSEGDLVAFLAERSGFPGVDLSRSAFLLAALDLIPRPVAEGDQILPLSTEGGRLHIAVTRPAVANDSIDEVRFITGMEISLYVALSAPLERCVLAAFDGREKGETMWRGHALEADAQPGLTIIQPAPVGPEYVAAERKRISSPGVPKPRSAEVTLLDESNLEEAIIEGEPLEEVLEADEVLEEIDVSGMRAVLAREPDHPRPPPAVKAPAPLATAGIEIEIADDGEDEEEEVVGVVVRSGPKRVLVVDDEPDIIRLCTKPLQLKGYAVESALDGEAAEERLKKKPPPDLVLLDAMLPLVHGFEICQRIKSTKALRSVQVIMMSAVYRGWRFAQDAKETYGADDFIEKPFHLADLLRRVDERLAEGKSLAVTKESTEKLYRSGVELLAAGQAKEGRAALEAAAREDPFSPRIQFALARALASQGDVYRAITAYERAVELRPKLFPALKNLALLYQEKGFRKKAAETLERAFASAPDPMARAEIRAQIERLV